MKRFARSAVLLSFVVGAMLLVATGLATGAIFVSDGSGGVITLSMGGNQVRIFGTYSENYVKHVSRVEASFSPPLGTAASAGN